MPPSSCVRAVTHYTEASLNPSTARPHFSDPAAPPGSCLSLYLEFYWKHLFTSLPSLQEYETKAGRKYNNLAHHFIAIAEQKTWHRVVFN